MRVSFPGPRGTYSEGAAKAFFGDSAVTVPAETFGGALQMVESGESEYATIPIENMMQGAVGQSYDLLLSTPLVIVGEIYYPILHCLIGLGDIGQADTVYSHPQALEQCRKFIGDHGLRQMVAISTADSVRIVKDLNRADTVCIAGEEAARLYGIPVMLRNIADQPQNYTRFFMMSKVAADPARRNKTSLVVSVRDEPGALHRVLGHFLDHGINITKIMSRPKKSGSWQYNFFIDFSGHDRSHNIQEMIAEIRQQADFLKLLGSYPASPVP